MFFAEQQKRAEKFLEWYGRWQDKERPNPDEVLQVLAMGIPLLPRFTRAVKEHAGGLRRDGNAAKTRLI